MPSASASTTIQASLQVRAALEEAEIAASNQIEILRVPVPLQYTIQQGDSIVNIAFQHGFHADTLWNHPDNAVLRRERADMNILLPGDVLVIPDKRPKAVNGATGMRHAFQIKGIPAIFRLQIFDVEEPRENQSYELVLRGPFGEKKRSGVTDGEGVLQVYVPPDARSGALTIGPDAYRLDIAFGELDPINTLSGVQKRLKNLGFDCGEPDGESDAATRSALSSFQRRFDLPVTGEADAATVAKLEAVTDEISEFPEESP